MSKNIYLIVDTECIGLQDKSIYDIAWQIVDKHGNIYYKASHLVKETITNANKMGQAYYSNRVFSHYIPALDRGDIDIVNWESIRQEFNESIAEHNVNVLCAYNLGFDIRAISDTNGKGKFLEKKLKLLDLWQFACETLLSQKTFIKLAHEQRWISEAGNVRTNAEKAFAYATGEWTFEEQHTAAADVDIETTILLRCLQQKKKIPYGKINQQPWKIVNKK